MYKIRQVFLDHVGRPEVWFDKVWIPFFDPLELNNLPEATHTIVHLENGGGKTTLLSFLFSCFVPEKRLFIQHLQKPTHKFDDYFGPEPGLILVELEKRDSKESDARDLLVIGQYVRVQAAGQPAERIFFSFKPSRDLRFEKVPCMGHKTLSAWSDVLSWMVQHNRDPYEFQYFEQQSKWVKYLKGQKVDTWLASKQVDFCSAEGGIDAFVNFRSEKDFLKEFFYMVMNPDDTRDVRETLSTALGKLKKRPEYEAQRNLLLGLQEKMEPFAEQSKHYLESQREFNNHREYATRLHAALSQDILDIEERVRQEHQNVIEQETHLHTVQTEISAKDSDWEALEALRWELELSNAQAEKAFHEEALIEGQIREQQAEAALHLRKKQTHEQAMAQLEASIRAASSDLEPLRNAKHVAAWTFRTKLTQRREAHQEQQKVLENKRGSIFGNLKRLSQKRDQTQIQKQKTESDLKVIQFRMEERDRVHQRLVQEGVMHPEMPIDEQIEALKSALLQQEGLTKDWWEKHQFLDDQIHGISAEVQVCKEKQTRLKTRLELNEAQRDRGLEQQEAFHTHPVLQQIMESTAFDPASDRLTQEFSALLTRKENAIREALTGRERVQYQLQLLEQTASLLIDDNTQNALAQLHENGVKGAQLYPVHLAARFHNDVSRIGPLIESDPGRYLGIVVNTVSELEQVRKLNGRVQELRRPVMVSLLDGEKVEEAATHTSAPCVVLPPATQAVYSEQAAQKQQEGWQKQVQDFTDAMTEMEQEMADLRGLQQRLQGFAQTYGNDRLNQLVQACDEDQLALEKEETHQATLSSKKEALWEELNTIENRIEESQQQLNAAQQQLRLMEEFYQNYDQPLAGLRQNQRKLQKEVQLLDEVLHDIQQEQTDTQRQLDDLNADIQHTHALIQRYEDRIAQIGPLEDPPPQSSMDLTSTEETLQRLYENSIRNYELALNQTDLHGLQWSLDSEKDLYEAALNDYRHALGHLQPKAVEQLLHDEGDNLEDIAQKARRQTEEARVGKTRWETTIAQMQKERGDFENNRKYPWVESKQVDWDLAQITSALGVIEDRLEELHTAQKETIRRMQHTKERIDEWDSLKNDNKVLQAELRAYRTDTPPDDVELPLLPHSMQERIVLVSDHLQKVTQLKTDYEAWEKQAVKSHRNVLKITQDDSFKQVESRIAIQIAAHDFEEACQQGTTHLTRIQERIQVLNEQIKNTQRDVDLCVERLQSHTTTALSKLKQAVEQSRIPETVFHIGGKNVLKMKSSLFKITIPQRRAQLDQYVKSLIDKPLPGVGTSTRDELTAQAVIAIAEAQAGGSDLGLRILKLSQIESYTPIHQVTGSGGERLTAALLLYLVLAQLRAQHMSNRRDALGGFLVIDNPFGQANKPQFVEAQMKLAQELGFQLIYATGIQDFNSQAVFGHLVPIHRRFDPVNKRVHLEAAEFTLYN